jgi:Uma2 family endonuclease
MTPPSNCFESSCESGTYRESISRSRYDKPGQYIVPHPILLVEILSSDDARDTWDNVWSYTTIPSVREIVVVHSTRVMAEVLRRGPDGNWPAEPEEIGPDGALRLDSIAFACPLPEVFAQTHLAKA